MSLNPDFQWQPISTRGFLNGPLESVGRLIRALNQRMQQLTTVTEITNFRETENRTGAQIVIFTQEFDTAGYGWQTSGRQEIVTQTGITVDFVEYTGSGAGTVTRSHKYDPNAFVWRNAWAFDDASSSARAPFQGFTDGDATPDVEGAVCWKTANTTATTITRFDHSKNADTLKHLFLVLIDDANTTIDFSQAGLEGNNGQSWKGKQGDLLLCVRGGGTSPVTSCTVPSQGPTIPETATGTFGVANVATKTVTHGMTGTPTYVALSPIDSLAAGWMASNGWFISSITSTQFIVDFNGAIPAGSNVDWNWFAVV